MKKILFIPFILLSIGLNAQVQDCEQIAKDCSNYLNGKNGGETFVSDGQIYRAFLDREQAEFKTTFYGGSTYRIAASAGKNERYVIFTVRDIKGNVLFTNAKHKNAPYWDFKIPTTIPVVIQTELDNDLKSTGCAVMLIGFKKN
ncbi:MAG: hypothetical protein KJ941_10445 [Bacteroidetes bacterium]|nr:hypothetical protein [Bacteroidota bacterium]